VAGVALIYRYGILPSDESTLEYGGGKVHFVQAEKRAVFVFNQPSNAGFACPEPSPDVRAAIDRVIKGFAEAKGNLPKEGSADLTATLDSTRKLVTESLMQRTQGLQVLRDMLFQACLANVRGDMGSLQYVNFISNTLPRLTTSLIATELLTKQDNEKLKLSSAELQIFLNFLILNMQ